MIAADGRVVKDVKRTKDVGLGFTLGPGEIASGGTSSSGPLPDALAP